MHIHVGTRAFHFFPVTILIMRFQKIWLSNFRSYTSQLFEFTAPTTILVGKNAAGKTSIIEAINLLAGGDSFRATKIEQMINFEADLARVKGKIIDTSPLGSNSNSNSNTSQEIDLEVLLTKGEVQGKRVRKRNFSINGTRRAKRKFVGQFLTVVFRPEDMRLVEGSKKRRRDFIDQPLTMVDNSYATSLNTYNQALFKRNKLLTQIREGEMPRETLTFWTMTVLKHAQVIQQKRAQFLDSFKKVDFPVPFYVEYGASLMTSERMEKYASREIAAGHTLIGPHKDDLIVKLGVETEKYGEEQRDVALYGSRGQQRMGVLWLKTCELQFLEAKTQLKPILLLDDILSELDEKHQQLVLAFLEDHQTIITTADEQTAQLISQAAPESAMINLNSD